MDHGAAMSDGHGGHNGGHGSAHHGGHHGDHGHHGGGHADHHGFGELVGGLAVGHGYLVGGHIGHHVGGHHGHHGFGHGHVGIADSMAEAIAMSVAMGGHYGGYHTGHIGHVPGFHGHYQGHGNNDQECKDKCRTYNIPGIARDAASVEVLMWPHSEVSPKKPSRQVNLKGVRDEIRKLAVRYGLTPIKPGAIDGNFEVDKTEERLLSNDAFGDDDDMYNPSNGWYKGAKGRTFKWREYYQLKPCDYTFLLNWLLKENIPAWRTYLVVSGVTWYYSQTGDFETRVSFSVWSKEFVDPASKTWTWDWKRIKQHRATADKLAVAVEKFLKGFPNSDRSMEKRLAIPPEDLIVEKPEPLPEPAPVHFEPGPVGSTTPAADKIDFAEFNAGKDPSQY